MSRSVFIPRSRHRRPLLHATALALALVAVALAGAPAAFGDTNKSANWSGYVAHRSGVSFDQVTASWIQPSATCVAGHRTYSAFWVGLGGYTRNSAALEQIGTEVDCAASGAVRSTAWYELVPESSRAVRLRVRPGDALAATVTVSGRRVTLVLHDATTRRTFRKTLSAPIVDTSSAEWIAEAPSVCFGESTCETLPLANFGSARFTSAGAQTTAGHAGTIADHAWDRTKISLLPRRTDLISAGHFETGAGESTPSALARRGSAFTVRYSPLLAPGVQTARARRVGVRAGRLGHPGLS